MEQLVFELAAPEPPTFRNFVIGRNAEAIAAARNFASGEATETGMLLWGAEGSGKSHVLQAAISFARECGRAAMLIADERDLPSSENLAWKLLAIDDVDRLSEEGQGRLFTLYNSAASSGAHLLAASRQPLATLAMREDVRTRLGWGLVYELAPLTDADKPAALADYARRRGFALSEDVIGYLLAHARRDMTAMCATLAALDRYSLATKRPITVPLLRQLAQRELALFRTAQSP